MPKIEEKLEQIHWAIEPFSGKLCIALVTKKITKRILQEGLVDLERAVLHLKELLALI